MCLFHWINALKGDVDYLVEHKNLSFVALKLIKCFLFWTIVAILHFFTKCLSYLALIYKLFAMKIYRYYGISKIGCNPETCMHSRVLSILRSYF